MAVSSSGPSVGMSGKAELGFMMGGGDDVSLAAGEDEFYAMNGSVNHNTAAVAEIRVPFDCIIDELRAQINSDAGAGETYTFFLVVEGVSSALTCVIGGAVDTEGEDLVNQIQVDEDDRICIRIVTSGGATSRIPTWSVKVRPRGP